mgnify:FL=1
MKDGTEEVSAVIVPSKQLYDELDCDAVEKLIKSEVKKLSLYLTAYKRPVNIIINREPLPRTATNKIKRNKVKGLVTA